MAKYESVPKEDIQVALCCNLGALGATTATIRSQIEKAAATVAQKNGLVIAIQSEIPSGVGRPQTRSKGGDRAAAANDSSPGLESGAAALGLPAAPDDFRERRDKGELRALLSADYNKLLAEIVPKETKDLGRHAESVFFKTSQKSLRAVAVLPSSNCLWLKTTLMDTASLDVGPLASSFVDLGPGAGPKARKRELVIHRHLRDATEPERQQRGTGFFMHLFDDLCKAGSAYAEERKKKQSVILYVSVWAASGEYREALAEWAVQRLKRSGGPKIYGLFWEKQEGRWLVTKARGEMKVAELYERQEIQFEGFTPAQEPDTSKKLREECGKDLVVAGDLVKFSNVDGKLFPIIPDESQLKIIPDDVLRKRLAQWRKQYPGLPAAKRARVLGAPG